MWRLLLVIVVAVSLGLAACGDDDGADPVLEPTFESPAEELMRRHRRFQEADFRATYEISATGDGSVMEGRFTWYQKDGEFRGDWSGLLDGVDQDIIVMSGSGSPSEQFYVCGLHDETCVDSGPLDENLYSDGQNPVIFASFLVSATVISETYRITTAAFAEVLGQDVVCFGDADSEQESFGSAEVCVTEDGVALRITSDEIESGFSASAEAVEFSRDVNDSVFELPYAVID